MLTCNKCEKKVLKTIHPFADFVFCKDCFDEISPKVKKEIERILQDYIQPERLSERDPKGYAIV